MNRLVSRFLLPLLLLVPVVSAAAAGAAGQSGERDPVSKEERLVRAAYAKLAAYNRASYARPFGRSEAFADALALKFELRDFQTGWLDDRRTSLIGELVTLASGEIVQGASHAMAGERSETLAYSASWRGANWSTLKDPGRTLGDVLAGEAAATYDLGKYTSYEVTVSFEGRERTYRALAVYRNRFDAAHDFVPEFIDEVVGLGGALTSIARDARAVYQAPEAKRLRLATAAERLAIEGATGRRFDVAPNSGCHAYFASDSNDHDSGAHGVSADFCNSCELGGLVGSTFTHTCDSVVMAHGSEDGNVTGLGSHSYKIAMVQGVGRTAPATSQVSCESAFAIVVTDCGVFGCGDFSVSVGVSGSGGEAQATWSAAAPNQIWGNAAASGMTCPAREVETGATTMTQSGNGGSQGPGEDLDQQSTGGGCTNFHYYVVWVRVGNVIYVISADYIGCD